MSIDRRKWWWQWTRAKWRWQRNVSREFKYSNVKEMWGGPQLGEVLGRRFDHFNHRQRSRLGSPELGEVSLKGGHDSVMAAFLDVSRAWFLFFVFTYINTKINTICDVLSRLADSDSAERIRAVDTTGSRVFKRPPLPSNTHWITRHDIPPACRGWVLNPLTYQIYQETLPLRLFAGMAG